MSKYSVFQFKSQKHIFMHIFICENANSRSLKYFSIYLNVRYLKKSTKFYTLTYFSVYFCYNVSAIILKYIIILFCGKLILKVIFFLEVSLSNLVISHHSESS